MNATEPLTPLWFSGHEWGNGGDGVRMQGERIVLYDLYEARVDADDAVENFKVSPYALPLADLKQKIRRLPLPNWTYSSSQSRPIWTPVRRALLQILTVLKRQFPVLTDEILSEAELFQWAPKSEDLAPNPDTDPVVELGWNDRIGCARNVNFLIAYSPETFFPIMSGPNEAALVLHEAFYSMYRRRHPEVQTSYSVRQVVGSLFRLSGRPSTAREEFLSTLENNGFADVAQRERNFVTVAK
ncbi:MAG: hypothetical protein JST16_16635 [Bdellovibrionales bacterium]|nr:hypothetical protein [Bdellovibrionales bacterium]